MFDGTTLGLVTQLSHEETFSGRDHHGCVVSMVYCDSDELLFVALAGGVIKAYSGCHRGITYDVKIQVEEHLTSAAGFPVNWCELCVGGHAPTSPQFLRANYAAHESTIVDMAVSEEMGLVAVSGSDGSIRIFDYFNLALRRAHFIILVRCIGGASQTHLHKQLCS
jgi:hypothetical protein